VTDPTLPIDSPFGLVFYQGAVVSIPARADGGGSLVEYKFDLSELHLEAGHQYAWIIDTVSTRDGVPDLAQSLGMRGYEGGDFFGNLGQTLEGGPWIKSGFDLAFKLDFSNAVSDGHDIITDFSVKKDFLTLNHVIASEVTIRDVFSGTEVLTPNDGSILLSGVHVLAPNAEVMASDVAFDWLLFS
jgi:hypothetical protein